MSMIAGFLLLILSWFRVDGCTIICVGKDASVDGSTIVAHTDDAGGVAADIRLVNVPAMDHPPGSQRAVYDFGSGYPRVVTNDRGPHYKPAKGQNLSEPLGYIPQVAHTYAYFDQDYGMVNEVSLAIAESTCSARTVGWPSNLPYGYNLFGISELSKVALERCDSARCAITTMGSLAEQYGFYSEDSGDPNKPGYEDSSEALGISDKYGEVWIFQVLTGLQNRSAIWAAQRVEDDRVVAVANGFVIRQMNLSDPDNFMASDNVEQVAKDMGWWNPDKGPFDFTAAYSQQGERAVSALYVGRRMWRIYDIIAPSLKLNATWGWLPDYPTYPFSVKPDKLVSVKQVQAILGDYYQGTPYDMSTGMAAGPFGSPIRYDGPNYKISGGWERPISSYRTMFSFVITNKRNLPHSIGCVVWYGQGTPAQTVYVPFGCAQRSVPSSYLLGKESKAKSGSAWWAFKFINNWSQLRYDLISKYVRQHQMLVQNLAFQQYASILSYAQTTPTNNNELKLYVEQQLNQFAVFVVDSWWELAWEIVSKFNDGFVIDGELPGEMQTPGYPQWYLQSTDFAAWPGSTFDPPDDSGYVQQQHDKMVGIIDSQQMTNQSVLYVNEDELYVASESGAVESQLPWISYMPMGMIACVVMGILVVIIVIHLKGLTGRIILENELSDNLLNA